LGELFAFVSLENTLFEIYEIPPLLYEYTAKNDDNMILMKIDKMKSFLIMRDAISRF